MSSRGMIGYQLQLPWQTAPMLQVFESSGASTQGDVRAWLQQPLYLDRGIPLTADKEALSRELYTLVTALLLRFGVCVKDVWGQPVVETCETGAFFKYICNNPWLSRCINQTIACCDVTCNMHIVCILFLRISCWPCYLL